MRNDLHHPSEARDAHILGIRRAVQFMRANFGERLTLGSMAAVAHMSPCHFVRVFHNVTGIPPARFLGAIRLQQAKYDLLRTSKAVWEICNDVGYASLGSFTTRFTQLVGVSPAHYREMYRLIIAGKCVPGPSLERHDETSNPGQCLSGTIRHELADEPIMIVGLFRSPIPQDAPLACDVLMRARPFRLVAPDNGPFHVLAVALTRVCEPGDLFDNSRIIGGVASSGPLTLSPDKSPSQSGLQLALRDHDALDPPILVAFPLLMYMQLALSLQPETAARPRSRPEKIPAGKHPIGDNVAQPLLPALATAN